MALTIGQVARAANVHVETLRYYERRGLVPKPPRSSSLYRHYPDDTVPRVQFVKHAQALGFALREIRQLLSLRAGMRVLDAPCGEGRISAGSSGAFAGLAYSNAARIGNPEGKTSPEELLAAAHGGCFTMSLAGELAALGHPPGRLATSCRIVMDEVEGQGHQIVASFVDVVVAADGLDEGALAALVVKADEGCPFSALLRRAGAEVHVSARLA